MKDHTITFVEDGNSKTIVIKAKTAEEAESVFRSAGHDGVILMISLKTSLV